MRPSPHKSSANFSIVSMIWIISACVRPEFWMTSRKKFGLSWIGWYVIIMVPVFIMRSLTFGATRWRASRNSWASASVFGSGRFRNDGGKYQKQTFVHSGSSNTILKPGRCLMVCVKNSAQSNAVSICCSRPLVPFARHINQNLRTSARRPHWICLSPVSYFVS